MLTSNEVINAKTSQNQCDLFIVHSMEVEMQDGEYDITTGVVAVLHILNHEPVEEHLAEIRGTDANKKSLLTWRHAAGVGRLQPRPQDIDHHAQQPHQQSPLQRFHGLK